MIEGAKFFVETSVHINLWIGTRKTKAVAREHLDGRHVVVSRHVAAEYKRAIVGSLCTFANLVLDSDSVGEALKRLSKYRDRTPLRVLQLIGEVIDRGMTGRGELLSWCELMIREVAMSRFFMVVDEVVDEIRCLKADAKPERIEGVWRLNALCKEKESPRCGVDEFVEKRSEELKVIEEFLELNPGMIKGQEKVAQELVRVVKRRRVPYGRRCQRVSDILITLEAPADAQLCSADNDYAALCRATGKSFLPILP